jgi:hypothetical protein
MMFIIVNRHKEILYTDGEFYPAEAFVVQRSPRLFQTEAEADEHRQTIHDYTKTMPTESSL